MANFLNLSGVFWAGGVALALVSGYLIGLDIPLTWHVFIGLIALLGAIMTFSIDLFYFITTGSHIRDAAEKKLVPVDDYKKSRRFKSVIFPLIMVSISLFIALPALGGAYDVGTLEIYYHAICGWAAVLIYIYAVKKVGEALKENREIFERTVKEVNRDAEGARHTKEEKN